MATKDKKPFTYLPGGLDLSEIRSPRMQRRLERNAQTPPSPEQVPQKSPEYQPQQVHNVNLESPKPMCNVRPASEKVCLLPQVQHQPQLNKAPTPWMQKAAQVQPTPAPWTHNKNEYVDQSNKTEERVVPVRVETNRPIAPSQPLKNNTNHLNDSEPIQGRSFKVLQQITEPKNVYDGSQAYNSQSLPLSELRKLQLSDDDRSFMNKVKSQVDDDKFLHNETDPRYRGASIPSRSFRMLQTLTNSAPVPMHNNQQPQSVTHYVSVEPIESKIYVPPSERPAGTEPHKYTGGSIPSRSFKMLQAMTGQNNEEDDLQTRSFTPCSFICPEFWQHYEYLQAYHDKHAGRADHPQQQLADAVCVTRVLNTADEDQGSERDVRPRFRNGDEPIGNDDSLAADCEVSVTITLPMKKNVARSATKKESAAAADSPVDFWQRINDCGEHGKPTAPTSDSGEPSEDAAAVVTDAAVDCCSPDDVTGRRRSDEDVDSGITAVSAETSLQASEKDVNSGGGGSKKYKRTCTHSRLYNFLRSNDCDDGNKLSAAAAADVSWSTSGYSSAATTPSSPSAAGGQPNQYESDTARAEYDSYYSSWENACPYFGYDILPSKAFKTIAQPHNGSPIKFKCPKIPIAGDGGS